MTAENPTDVRQVKASLCRLAGPSDEQIVERAIAAVDDLEAAVAFVETIGLAELDAALETVGDPDLEIRGRHALDSFDRFQRAADGHPPGDHFHSGHGTDLRDDHEGSFR